jgi:signal transduction histidine kinase
MVIFFRLFLFLLMVLLLGLYFVLIKSSKSDPKEVSHSRTMFTTGIMVSMSILWIGLSIVLTFDSSIAPGSEFLFDISNRLSFLVAMGMIIVGYFIIREYPAKKRLSLPVKMLGFSTGIILVIVIALLISGDLLSGGYYFQPDSNLANSGVRGSYINQYYFYEPGSISPVYGLFLLVVMGVSVRLGIARKYTQGQSKIKLSQSHTIAIGLILSIVNGVLFQLVLPYFIRPYPNTLYMVGQLAPLFITSSILIAMIKHRFLDVKTSAFRAVGYLLSLATVIILSSSITFLIVIPLVNSGSLSGDPLGIVLLTILGNIFNIYAYLKIRPLFDKVTDRIFFRGSYQIPDLLNEFNQVLVNNIALPDLSKGIIDILQKYMKAESLYIYINHQNEVSLFGLEDSVRPGALDLEKLAKKVKIEHLKSSNRIVGLVNSPQISIRSLPVIEKLDLSMALDLGEATSQDFKNGQAGLKYRDSYRTMLLGQKLSGNPYTKKDINVLEIISKELVIALQNSLRYEEIRLFNKELQDRIDDATKKLKQQNTKLLEVDSLKDEFLSIASHQMRTPISTIVGYASMLEEGDAGPLQKEQKKFAKNIEDGAKSLNYLIDEFLTVSRLKSGKFSIDRAPFKLNVLVRDVYLLLAPQAKLKDIKLNIHLPSEDIEVYADQGKMRQVIMNIVDNAIHYTPSSGTVDINLKKVKSGSSSSVVFEVVDNGIGVPTKSIPKLFTKMFRASNAMKARPDGTGLGLYLAKKVVLGHGGSIIFKSKEGEGSTFGFRMATLK